ncbi:MAG: MerR family DNA-binding transcriptional regulator, partial [Thermoanaerobaculia bacterium]
MPAVIPQSAYYGHPTVSLQTLWPGRERQEAPVGPANPLSVLELRNTSMKFSGVLRHSFSTAEVARLTGLSPRQLDHWDRLGFLRPSLERASGY